MAEHPSNASVAWVVLTMGDRDDELRAAVESIRDDAAGSVVVVVWNGSPPAPSVMATGPHVDHLAFDDNVGVPAGRDAGLRAAEAPIVAFLDDDAAVRSPGVADLLARRFAEHPDLGAVTFKLVDEHGAISRRHVPRVGRRPPTGGDAVATFLGGACAIRRDAYLAVGGYDGDLFYGHEELDLAWRLIDAGYRIEYVPDVEVYHPRTEVGRHAAGWWYTGRNRVRIARRNLPWPVLVAHVAVWLVVGTVRAGGARGAYLRGWRDGWRGRVARRPIRWTTVWRLTRAGRPPVI